MINTDTIFALSTLYGKSGIAVIRISGPKVTNVINDFKIKIPKPRYSTLTKLISPIDNEPLDNCISIYFKSPDSFTGEDILELQLHGSPAVINDTLRALGSFNYLRPAEPGEFSKRAFLSGKLDLTKAEGLAQLINSETSLQRKIALRQLEGSLYGIYDRWRQKIIEILSIIEALVDFPDEDLPKEIIQEAKNSTNILLNEIQKHVASARHGITIMEGWQVAIVGAPNVGKSSLLNAMADREVAIVSEREGTTRDVIEVRLNLEGYLVTLYDTAGIRDADDSLEQEGISRTRRKLQESDIIIYVSDVTKAETADMSRYGVIHSENVICCINKIDLLKVFPKIDAKNSVLTSVNDKESISRLINFIIKYIKERCNYEGTPIVTNLRYKHCLEKVIDSLSSAFNENFLELTAFHLHQAANYIGMITGVIDIDEILDKIFSSFCIGK